MVDQTLLFHTASMRGDMHITGHAYPFGHYLCAWVTAFEIGRWRGDQTR